MTETMYQNLVANVDKNAPISVHLTDFPKADLSLIDKNLEEQMEEVVAAVQLGRACRNLANIKVRQPISTMYIKGAELDDAVAELIADELNVKKVSFVTDAREFTTYELKPQMRTLGPKYGKLLGKIGAALKTMDGNDVVDAFERGETVSFDVSGTTVELTAADVLTKPMQKPGFVAQVESDMTVVLDTNLTPELIEEGYVREVISKIQTMRKDADFDVTDRIRVKVISKGKLTGIVNAKAADIMGSVLAVELTAESMEGELSKKVADIVKSDAQETLTGAALVENLGLDITADAVQCWNINGANAVIAVTVAK
jgi:isoleucyl-tRNA synthetase